MVNPLSSGGVKMTILNKKNYIPNGSLIYHTDGSVTNHQGFTINHLEGMKASTEYMISFKAKVILGQVKSIGVLKRINHTKGEILLDSVKLSDFNTHTAVTNTTINNGEFHEFIITFTTVASPALVSDNISDANVLGDVFFVNYDQPAECSIEIKDLKWEIKGEQPTKWSRPPEDLTVPFEMIDAYTKDETDSLLDNKANVADVYTKNESDTLLDDKANVVDVYTKTDSYNKEEVDKLIEDVTGSIGGGGSDGGSSVDAYTKVEVDDKLKNYLPKNAGDSNIYADYGYLQITSYSLEFNVDSFRMFDRDITSILFEVSTSAIRAHKKLYIYDKICVPDENGDIDLIRRESFNNYFGSSLSPTIIESSEIPKVRYNGMNLDIATESMVNDTVDQALKKIGTSAVFVTDPDYANRISSVLYDRVNDEKYSVTYRQLNTLILDSGIYYSHEIKDLSGKLIGGFANMVIVHTSGNKEKSNVFFSEQIAINVGPNGDPGRQYKRVLKYTINDNGKITVSAVKDWSYKAAVPYPGYEIDSINQLFSSVNNLIVPTIGFYTIEEGYINSSSSISSSCLLFDGYWENKFKYEIGYGNFSEYISIANGTDTYIEFLKDGVYRLSINVLIASDTDVTVEHGVFVTALLYTSSMYSPYKILGQTYIGGTLISKNSPLNPLSISLKGDMTFDITTTHGSVNLRIGLSGKLSEPLPSLKVIPTKLSDFFDSTFKKYDMTIEYLGPLTTE